MDLTKAIEKIEANRVQAEASFVFVCGKIPSDTTITKTSTKEQIKH